MKAVECPTCEKDASEYPEWLYDNHLYEEQEGKPVNCPFCGDPFWVKSWTSFEYTTAKLGDDL